MLTQAQRSSEAKKAAATPLPTQAATRSTSLEWPGDGEGLALGLADQLPRPKKEMEPELGTSQQGMRATDGSEVGKQQRGR